MSATRISIAVLLLANVAVPALAESKKLPLVWEHETPRVFPQAILRDQTGRDCLHVALKNGGLAILDITRPNDNPTLLATVETTMLGGLEVMHLSQQKHLLYLALGDFFDAKGAHAGLAVVDVADPRMPKVLSVWKSEEKLQGAAAVIVRDKSAYLGAMKHGVFTFDVSDPKKIRKERRNRSRGRFSSEESQQASAPQRSRPCHQGEISLRGV